MLPVFIDEWLIDVYYYLDKSCERFQAVKHSRNLFGIDTREILRHVLTPWLSLGLCVGRLLQQWEPLLANFARQHKQKSKCYSSKRSDLNSSQVKSSLCSSHSALKSSSANSSAQQWWVQSIKHFFNWNVWQNMYW